MTQAIPRTIIDTPSLGECPLCGLVELNHRFEKKSRQFWACSDCGIEFQWPLPSPGELERYYDEQFADGMYSVFTSAAQMKTLTARQRLKEIGRWVPYSGRWLDVGCADGVFVREAAATGVAASGVELSSVGVEKAIQAGLDVRCGRLEELPHTDTYDCITAFDVLEHVLDPRGFILEIYKRLNPGGFAALTLPDLGSIFSKLMGSRWWFYIPEEHLHYFNKTTVSALGHKAGLQTVHVGATYKPLTYNYGLTQFIEFNPMIYRVMKLASAVLPRALKEWIVPLYIGEMKVIFRKPLSA
ncbi:MAG: class I SAM-dependent methyltransferase [Verrucomicrobiaceae bacterium]|nr:class I SAM-dependent methyltransferase [Verrucomicrobiaceae bacterium]